MKRREKGTGSVYEDAKRPGRYIGEVRIAGKRHRVSGADKTEVRRKLRALTAKRDTGQAIGDRRATVNDAITTFMTRDVPNRDLAPKTLEIYEWTARLIRDEIGTVRLDDLDADIVETMLDRLADREHAPLSRSSLTKVRGTLQRALAFAERRGQVTRNAALVATIPPQAARTVKRQALSPSNARRLLDALRAERNGLMFGLSLHLGLRPGEAAALYWSNVSAGAVNITRGLRLVKGRPVIVDEVKTSGSRRTIELPPDVADWLEQHRLDQTAERKSATRWADDRLVFASSTGTVIEPRNARRHLTEICASLDELGVDGAVVEAFPRIKPNELRHSCASLLSDEGVPLELIADLLGHASTDMLDRTYRHRVRPSIDTATRARWAEDD